MQPSYPLIPSNRPTKLNIQRVELNLVQMQPKRPFVALFYIGFGTENQVTRITHPGVFAESRAEANPQKESLLKSWI